MTLRSLIVALLVFGSDPASALCRIGYPNYEQCVEAESNARQKEAREREARWEREEAARERQRELEEAEDDAARRERARCFAGQC